MFERYTERARRVIFHARYEAGLLGSTTIESEHLLLGLLREDRNILSRFAPAVPPLESLRDELTAGITIREPATTTNDVPLSDDCKQILVYATEEAANLTHLHVGTEHLLLGVLRVENCVAGRFLIERGLRLDLVRDQLAEIVARQRKIMPARPPSYNPPRTDDDT
jgi:ATP-dependent Clp protease ATP-binding subunit ClpC